MPKQKKSKLSITKNVIWIIAGILMIISIIIVIYVVLNLPDIIANSFNVEIPDFN